MNIWDILIIIILAVAVFAAARHIWKNRKAPCDRCGAGCESASGCSRKCSSCSKPCKDQEK